jgi:glycine/D-amino acid oxidase-like deaminating enzyme
MGYDILVLGGGPSGVGAAVGAARLGVSVALIERHPALGGMGTSAMVNNFCPAHLDGSRLIIGGIFAELRQRLATRKAIYLSPQCGYAMEPYHPKVMEEEEEALCREAGVKLFLGQSVTNLEFPAADGVNATLADGTRIEAMAAVDATGDAMAAPAAGTPFVMGGAGKMMPLTYCYKIGPVDLELLREKDPGLIRTDPLTGEPVYGFYGFVDEVTKAREAGELTIPSKGIACALNVPGEPNYVTVNFGRVFVDDATDSCQLERAAEVGRKQVAEGEAFFRKYVPGFAQARVVEMGRQIGVRETRRIQGLYTLTEQDVTGCRQFEDAIAQCCYAIDIHDPTSGGTRLVEIPRGQHYDIPWRCLIPVGGAPNIAYAGRCISADQAAMSSFRVAPSVVAIGEAAGVTAALAVRQRTGVAQVGPDAVRSRLLATGAILE